MKIKEFVQLIKNILNFKTNLIPWSSKIVKSSVLVRYNSTVKEIIEHNI